jgi:hypothetical protein
VKRLWLRNVRRYTLISIRDFKRASAYHWFSHRGYACARQGKKHIYLHRLVMSAASDQCVDHLNRDPLDNRRINLRLCTRAQNTMNVSRRRNNKTGYTGVHFHKKNSSYVAYIGKRPRTHLGSFATAVEAARAYNKAAKKRFGRFACLNKLT